VTKPYEDWEFYDDSSTGNTLENLRYVHLSTFELSDTQRTCGSAHEAEKQYSREFCQLPFKNKNEAERHQNSAHFRRHYWSCSVLSDPEDAFQPADFGNLNSIVFLSDLCDLCGFCGASLPYGDLEKNKQHIENLTQIQVVQSFHEIFQ
jgi:hypothetical protein